MDDLRIAVVVMRSVLGKTADNLSSMKARVGEAAAGGLPWFASPS